MQPSPLSNCWTFLSLKKKPCIHWQPLPTLYFPQPLATTNLLCIFMILHILDISYKLSHRIYGLCDWLLSLSTVFSGFIYAVAWIDASFLFMAEFHCTDGPHFVYLVTSWWTFGFSHLLAITNTDALNIRLQAFVWTPVFNCFGYILWVEFDGS